MAVTKPRNRLVNFRVSEEEFQSLQKACLSGNARSVSDFARTAVLRNCGDARSGNGALETSLATIDHKVEGLEIGLRTLMERLNQPPVKTGLEALEEQVLRLGAAR